jgi:hypothetical protein
MPDYYVITIDGTPKGPLDSAGLIQLISNWELSPDSMMRAGKDGEWASVQQVAETMSIELPWTDEWKELRKAAKREDAKLSIKAYGVVTVVLAIILQLVGLGFLKTPLFVGVVLFLVICLILGEAFNCNVLGAKMWNDVRKGPEKGGGLKFVAFAISFGMMAAWYYGKIYGFG